MAEEDVDIDMDQILNDLKKVEEAAEEVLNDKQEIIDLNIRINKNREALNGLKRDKDCSDESKKIWISFGNSFIKTSIGSAKQLITEDQNDLNKRVDQLRNELKTKVNKLNELEGKDCIKGFDLKPLDSQELRALSSSKLISM